MSELTPTLDEWVKRHDELCPCSTMHIDDLAYCDCGQAKRAAELAELRAALDEARSILEFGWVFFSGEGLRHDTAAWMEAHPRNAT